MDISKLPIFSASSTLNTHTPSAKVSVVEAPVLHSNEALLPNAAVNTEPLVKPLNSADKINIIISPLSFNLSTYSKPKGVTQNVFSNTEQKSPLTQKFANQLEKDFDPHRLEGLGKRFGELISTGSNSYSQDIRRYSYYEPASNLSSSSTSNSTSNSAAQEVDFSDFKIRKKGETQSFSLELKTDSGAVVKFSIKSYEGDGKKPDELIEENDIAKIFKQGQGAGFRGIEIEFEVDGKLSQKEREQLSEFGNNLEKFSNDLFNDSQPNLKALNLSSFDTISEASIKANGGHTTSGLALEYKDNDKYRSVSLSFQGNKSEISVDKTNQLTFNANAKTEALQKYLKILDDGADEAKADSMQTHMMKEVFSAGFKINEKEEADAKLKEKERNEKLTIELNGNPPRTGEASNDVFIPLADFDFSFASRKDRPNSTHKPLEYSGFDLELSLDSQETIVGNQTTTSQTQDFKLKGAYYEPLPHLKLIDFENQNYRHTSFEREASKTVTTLVEDGQLLSAIMEESGSFESYTSSYSEGKLVDQDSEKNAYFEVTDLMEVFFKDEETIKNYNQIDILEKVMIDPYKDRD